MSAPINESTEPPLLRSATAELWLEALQDLLADFDNLPTSLATAVVARLHQVGFVNEAGRLWRRLEASSQSVNPESNVRPQQ